jgi:hypothetical protein
MPEISRFLGIIISMLYNEHNPPHFHAKYGDYRISVEILTGVVDGKFPPRALKAVLEWRELHIEELMEDWNLAQEHMEPKTIAPLE